MLSLDRGNIAKKSHPSHHAAHTAHHGLVIAGEHDPLQLSEAVFLDVMHTAVLWFQRTHEADPTYRYPHLMWDLLPKASASQLHPHAQACPFFSALMVCVC